MRRPRAADADRVLALPANRPTRSWLGLKPGAGPAPLPLQAAHGYLDQPGSIAVLF